MFKKIHPLTRVFWIALVAGVVIYQLNHTEYSGSDSYTLDIEHSSELSQPIEKANVCVLPVIFFDNRSNQLDLEATEELNEVAQRMINHPSMILEISGKRGAYEPTYMATMREQAVMKYLTLNFGISPRRLTILEDDAESFQSPHSEKESSHEHHSYTYDEHFRSHCNSRTYTRSSCRSSRRTYTCHKQKARKENRAVYLTCAE